MSSQQPFNPFAISDTLAESQEYPVGEGLGLPWEQSGFFIGRFFRTLYGIYFTPRNSFSNMYRPGSVVRAMVFLSLGSIIGTTGCFAWSAMPHLLSNNFHGMPRQDFLFFYTLGACVWVILSPILAFTWISMQAILLHGCLFLVSAANESLEMTFRAVAYVHGAGMTLLVIPICSIFGLPIWLAVVHAIAFSQVHSTTLGRSMFAVLIWVAVLSALPVTVVGLLMFA